MYFSRDYEFILWDGALYKRLDKDEHTKEEDRRHLFESEHVATEDILHEGRVIKKGEVIPPPALNQGGFRTDISVNLVPDVNAHDRLVESGQARCVTNVNKLSKGRGHRGSGS
jgi:hypothetical protein